MFESRRKAWLRGLLAAAWLAFLFLAPTAQTQNKGTPEQKRPVTEHDVKAAFLLNFVKFIEWPTGDESRAREPLSICVFGDDPFGPALDRVVAGETVQSRPLAVRRIRAVREDCDVLFIPREEHDQNSILQRVKPGMLTVGESPEFLRDGGMINFVIVDRRVRFDVNREAAERGLVRISSRLLGVARSVQP